MLPSSSIFWVAATATASVHVVAWAVQDSSPAENSYFDHLLTSTWTFLTLNVAINMHFLDHLPTSFCSRSFWATPWDKSQPSPYVPPGLSLSLHRNEANGIKLQSWKSVRPFFTLVNMTENLLIINLPPSSLNSKKESCYWVERNTLHVHLKEFHIYASIFYPRYSLV